MKFSKTNVPSIYDKPHNRRFLPPNNYQRPPAPHGFKEEMDDDDEHLMNHQERAWQDQLQNDAHQGSNNQDMTNQSQLIGQVTKSTWQQHRATDGVSGDAPMDLSNKNTVQNPTSPIRERSILPLDQRERKEQVYFKQEESDKIDFRYMFL